MSSLNDLSIPERHAAIAGAFQQTIDGVRDWDAPSPVKEWKASDVVDHLCSWIAGFLASETGTTIDTYEGPDLRERFRVQTASLQALLESPDADREVTTDWFGTMRIADIIDRFYVTDVFMHTWDLAKASGQTPPMDEAMAAELHAHMAAMGDSLRESGQFGVQQPVADDANDIDRLMAYIGRDPQWTPAA